MNRYAKQGLALCAMLVSGTVLASTTWVNWGGDRTWSTTNNWNNGLPTNQTAVIKGTTATDGQPIVHVADATTTKVLMNYGASLEIAAGASLHNTGMHVAGDTSGDYSTTTVSGTYTVDGNFALGGWNSGAKGQLVVESGGTINANGGWLIAGHETGTEGEIIVNGGTLHGAPVVEIGNHGTASLTFNSGFMDASWSLRVAYGTSSSGQVTINDGVISVKGLNVGANGPATIDFNGGRVVVGGNGLAQSANATFNFAVDGGELVINDGSSEADVNWAIDNGGGTWNFGEGYRTVTATTDGVVVKSVSAPIVEAATIVSSSISNNLMRLVIDAPTGPNFYYPVAKSDLITDSEWVHIPHSDDGAPGSFMETNLEYSAVDASSNIVIFLQIDQNQNFFEIEGAQP